MDFKKIISVNNDPVSLSSHDHHTIYQLFDDDLDALSNLNGSGFPHRISDGVWDIVTDIGATTSIGYAQDLTNSMTTSTTWQTKLSLNFVLDVPKTIVIQWGCVIWVNAANRDMSTRMYLDNTTVVMNQLFRAGSSTSYVPFQGPSYQIPLSAGNHNAKIQFVAPSGGAVNCSTAFVQIIQMN